MSLRFDDDARHEYLEAIRFYGRAAERFVQAVDVAIAQIRGDPERFREVEPRTCKDLTSCFAKSFLELETAGYEQAY
jgi:hypothetical protein